MTENRDITLSEDSNTQPFKRFQSVHQSQNHLKKADINFDYSARAHLKVLYEGKHECEGEMARIRSCVESNRLVIVIDLAKMKQKLYVEIETYRKFFREQLDADHGRIVQYLAFNGKYMELSGLKVLRNTIEEQ
jgi:16S rRNA C1402 (ribose-2'-O) methylase RsmI